MIPWLAACALRHVEHYEPVSFALDPVDDDQLARLPDALARELARGRLRSLAIPEGHAGATALDDLPPEAQYALYATLRPWSRGAELDLLVDTGAGPRPVTVWWSTQHDATVAWGEGELVRPEPPPEGLDAWMVALASEHGLGGFDGEVAWAAAEIGDLAVALDHLTPDERTAIDGVALRRMEVSPRSAARELAYFDPTYEPPVLDFYALAFEEGRYGFVGDAGRPSPAPAMTALHEFGHALADVPLRRAYTAYLEARDATAAATDPFEQRALAGVEGDRYRAYRGHGRISPVVAAWDAFRGGRKGPSSAGFLDPDESFAEAFALWHLDPGALERALPGATAWFASGAHLRAAGLVQE